MDMERTLKERPQGNEKMQLRYVSCDLKIGLLLILNYQLATDTKQNSNFLISCLGKKFKVTKEEKGSSNW